MTKKEKAKLEEAIELLLGEEEHFHKAISMLFGLLGRKWHIWEALNDPDLKSKPVSEITEEQPFKLRIKPEWIE